MQLWGGISVWSCMTRFQQADAVAEIKAFGVTKGPGISNREIARRLGVDEGTVRRMLKEAQLPKDLRTQIARGKSVNQTLREHRRRVNQALREQNDPVHQQNRRLTREKADGSISDDLAKKVLAFVRERFKWPCHARQAVQSAIDLAPGKGLDTILPRTDVDALMAEAKRRKFSDLVSEIEVGFRQLLWWLLHAAPERAIHIASLNKALLAIPKWGGATWDTVL
jgi:transposase